MIFLSFSQSIPTVSKDVQLITLPAKLLGLQEQNYTTNPKIPLFGISMSASRSTRQKKHLPPAAYTCHAANLQSLLALRPTTAHAPRLRALQVSGGDPALVEGTGLRATGDSRAVGADDGNLVGRVDFLGLAGGARGALAAFAAAALLGEEGGDPGVVDEVDDAAEGGEEEEVEEDAGGRGVC